MSTVPTSILNDLLDPLTQCFTPAVAKQVADLHIDANVQAKLDGLRQKANEGTLSTEERSEYEAIVETFDFIAILQAKSRRIVKGDAPK